MSEAAYMGDEVEYVLPTGPNAGQMRQAKVIRVKDTEQPTVLQLAVFVDGPHDGYPPDRAIIQKGNVAYSADGVHGTWHWPGELDKAEPEPTEPEVAEEPAPEPVAEPEATAEPEAIAEPDGGDPSHAALTEPEPAEEPATPESPTVSSDSSGKGPEPFTTSNTTTVTWATPPAAPTVTTASSTEPESIERDGIHYSKRSLPWTPFVTPDPAPAKETPEEGGSPIHG